MALDSQRLKWRRESWKTASAGNAILSGKSCRGGNTLTVGRDITQGPRTKGRNVSGKENDDIRPNRARGGRFPSTSRPGRTRSNIPLPSTNRNRVTTRPKGKKVINIRVPDKVVATCAEKKKELTRSKVGTIKDNRVKKSTGR